MIRMDGMGCWWTGRKFPKGLSILFVVHAHEADLRALGFDENQHGKQVILS